MSRYGNYIGEIKECNNIVLFCQDFKIEDLSYAKYFGWKYNKIFHWYYNKEERILLSEYYGYKFGLVVKSIKQK